MAKASSITVQVTGQRSLVRALRALGDTDVPFLDKALSESGGELSSSARQHTVGSIASAVSFVGLKGAGPSKRALVTVTHPGARAMEFGRTTYYRGYTGRKQKATGQKFKSRPGQKAKPFVGIKQGNAAIGATMPAIRKRIAAAVTAEWGRFDDSGGS